MDPTISPNQENNQGAPALNLNLSEAEDVTCENCQGTIFEEKMMVKKLSRFMTGSDRDSIVPIPVIVCSNCNHVNEMFKPNV